jgi:hypothetical protein
VSSWPEVPLTEVRKAFKNRHEVYEAIAYWVTEKGWRVRGQAHKFGLYPPNPSVRVIPPWVRVDGTVRADATWQAKRVHRDCRILEKAIEQALDRSD